jgi:hypothetical protein
MKNLGSMPLELGVDMYEISSTAVKERERGEWNMNSINV